MSEFEQVLEEKRKLVDEKATNYRNVRDDWNAKTKQATATRNEHNSEVRELIQNVKQQREIREQMNEVVRDMKRARADANNQVKEAKANLEAARKGPNSSEQSESRGKDRPMSVHQLRRKARILENDFEQGKYMGKKEKQVIEQIKKIYAEIKLKEQEESSNEDLKEARELLKTAMDAQEAAHLEVQKAANAAQDAHELMLQWNKEVDRQREKAESSHRSLRRSKIEGDKAHHFYIVSLRCLHSIHDILRARRGQAERSPSKGARVEIQDLMAKLMSGETLSTEELMQLQRNE